MGNVNNTTVRYVIYTNNTGNYSISDANIAIVNAAPVFTTVGYHDSNAATIAFTGNNQLIIQGQSTLRLDIASGDKAVALKGATMVSYTATINSVPTNVTYSASTIDALGCC